MTEILRRHSLVFTVICLFVLSFQLMSASIQNAALPKFGANLLNSFIGPVEVVHHEATHSVSRVWEHYIWLQNVEEERNEFAARVKELEAQNSRLVESQHENARLRELLSYQERNGRRGIAASVVGRAPSNWSRTVTLNRGSNDGIEQGLAVVDGNAVVGQIIAVGPATSRVLLVTDSTSAVDAIVQNSRAQGIAEGATEKLLRLRYVLKEYPVATGDRVIASGFDGVYPKGTLLGVVTRVEQSVNGLFQNVEVQPSIDTNRLETVLVLLPEANLKVETASAAGVSAAIAAAGANPSNPSADSSNEQTEPSWADPMAAEKKNPAKIDSAKINAVKNNSVEGSKPLSAKTALEKRVEKPSEKRGGHQ